MTLKTLNSLLICLYMLLIAVVGTFAQAKDTPEQKQAIKDLISKVSFVGDFKAKPETRDLHAEEPFWRYPLTIPTYPFKRTPLMTRKQVLATEMPQTIGGGRSIQHMNHARKLFLAGKLDAAKNTLLAARARYGTTNIYHRRADFFTALTFLHLVPARKKDIQILNAENNAATFLSWAFQVKTNVPDEHLFHLTPKYLYDLATIYYNAGKYSGAFGIVNDALEFLRQHGKHDYRVKFNRMLAEAYIRNRSYLEATRLFDSSLLEPDITVEDAASILGRVADIYFDLNNFELAEEIYGWAIRADNIIGVIKPYYYVLRGESLFWLGRYAESQRMFHYALKSAGTKVYALDPQLAALSSIRTADAWLAQINLDYIEKTQKKYDAEAIKTQKIPRGEGKRDAHLKIVTKLKSESLAAKKPLKSAKLAYAKHIRMFPKDHTADHAKIRQACLYLPYYKGQNIHHARNILEELKANKGIKSVIVVTEEIVEKKGGAFSYNADEGGEAPPADPNAESPPEEAPPAPKGPEIIYHKNKKTRKKDYMLPKEAVHLAWGCQTASYAKHERSQEMVNKVKRFARLYPTSRFIQSLIEPVRETQAKNLDAYLQQGDIYSAALFFEKNKERLFKDPSRKLKKKMFYIYIDTFQSEKAHDLFQESMIAKANDLESIKIATFAAETTDLNQERSIKVAEKLNKHKWHLSNSSKTRLYLDRIVSSPGGKEHLPWIVKLVDAWAQKDSKVNCSLLFPLISQAYITNKEQPHQNISRALEKITGTTLTEIIQYETFCGYAILEFEMSIYKNNMDALFEKYKKRDYLPINDVTGPLFWKIAEHMARSGESQKAQLLWKKLSDSGEDQVKEVKYAKLRLSTYKTQLENIWD